MPSIGRLTVQIGADTRGILNSIQNVENKLGKFSKGFGSLGKNLFGSLSAAGLLEVGRQAIVASSQFETAFLKIKNLTDTSTQDLAIYKNAVKSISTQVGVSSLELSQGLYNITSAGASGKVALDILGIAAKGAALGMGTVDEVSKSLTSTINAYGPANLTAARAAEILFKTTKQGALDINELGAVLPNVTSLAATMGVKMEEVGAFLATVSLNGTNASEGVTQLRSVLDAIINPSDQAQKILTRMGISLADLQDTVRNKGLRAALLDLEEGFKGNTQAVAQFFGRKEATIGFLSALGTNAEKYGSILRENYKDTNDFGKATQEALQSSSARWAKFTSALGNDLLKVGDSLKTFILKANDFLLKFDEGVKKLGAKNDLDGRLFGKTRNAKERGTTAAEQFQFGFNSALKTNNPFDFANKVAISASATKSIYELKKEVDSLFETISKPNKNIEKPLGEFEINILSAKRASESFLAETLVPLLDKVTPKVDKLQEAFQRVKREIDRAATGSKFGFITEQLESKADQPRSIQGKVPGLEGLGEGLEGSTTKTSEFQKALEGVNITLQNIGIASAQAFGQLAGELLTGGIAFKDLGKAALDAARQIIKAALSEALAVSITSALKTSKGNLLAGIGLAVGGVAIISSLFKSKVPKLAKGGIAYGPQLALVGDNPNARQDPEVISPLSKLKILLSAEVLKIGKILSTALENTLSTLDLGNAQTQNIKVSIPNLDNISRFIPNILPETNLDLQPRVVDVNVSGRIAGQDILLLNNRLGSTNDRLRGFKYNQ